MKLNNKTIKIAGIVSLLFFLQNHAFAQEEDFEEFTFRDRLMFGVTVGWVSRTQTIFEVIPSASYRITNRWLAGVGLKYELYKKSGSFFSNNTDLNHTTSIFGGTLFTNYEFLKNFPSKGLSFYVHTEFEYLNLSRKTFKDSLSSGRFFHPSYVAGVGLRQKFAKRASFNILLLLAFNKPSPSPYPDNPFFRFAILF